MSDSSRDEQSLASHTSAHTDSLSNNVDYCADNADNVEIASAETTNEHVDVEIADADCEVTTGSRPAVDVAVSPDVQDDNSGSRNRVNGDSYASRAAKVASSAENFRGTPNNTSGSNEVPKRPRSAWFAPSRTTSARSVFSSLKDAGISDNDVTCMQRKLNGEIVVTFSSAGAKERFLKLSALKIDDQVCAVQDIDRPLVYLTIYDAPFELSDLAIIKRLAPFCQVVTHRRGRFDFLPQVYNGLRHYRVRILRPVPSFLRFGNFQITLKHSGQKPTCRRCNRVGHRANNCDNKVCFNCEHVGHEQYQCEARKLCCICKDDTHVGYDCPYSWISPAARARAETNAPNDKEQESQQEHREPEIADEDVETADSEAEGAEEEEDDAEESEMEDGESVSSDASTHTAVDDSFSWADASDLDSDAVAEMLPLASALPTCAQDAPETPQSPSSDAWATMIASVARFSPAMAELMASANGQSAQTFQQPVLPASQQLDSSQQSPDPPSSCVLDSQGLIKPPASAPGSPPANDPTVGPVQSSTTSTVSGRLRSSSRSRREPAPIPEPLAAAGARKPTVPAPVAAPCPREADLKRKAANGTSTDVLDKKKRSTKKGT